MRGQRVSGRGWQQPGAGRGGWEPHLGSCVTFSPDLQYIDDQLPAESPYLYGLHPNAEIGFLTQTSEKLFRTVLELQPRDGHAGAGAGTTREEKVGGQGGEWPELLPGALGRPSRCSSCRPPWSRGPCLAHLLLACGRLA